MSRTALWVIGAASIIGFVIGGIGSVAIGLLIDPLMHTFSWSNEQTSSIAAAFMITSLVTTPLGGLALDRYGVKIVMSIGVAIFAGGFLGLSQGHQFGELLAWTSLMGVGFAIAFYVPTSVVVTSWAGGRKSFAMGVLLFATSLGAAAASPVIQWMMDEWGWRTACQAISLVVLMILPIAIFAVKKNPSATNHAGSQPWSLAKTARDLGTPLFLLCSGSAMAFAAGMGAVYYHMVPAIAHSGYSAQFASWALGGSWVLSAIGSIITGSASTRFGPKRVLGAALILCALGTLALIAVGTSALGMASLMAFLILWGCCANCVSQLLPVLFAAQFGEADLGAILGIESALAGLAGGTTPMLTGWIYDQSGSYSGALLFSASMSLIAAVFVGFIAVKAQRPVEGW